MIIVTRETASIIKSDFLATSQKRIHVCGLYLNQKIIYSGVREMGAVKKGVTPKNAPLVKRCTRVNSVI